VLGDPITVLFEGIAVGVGLCCTLGPQSVFVLRQGLHGESALRVAAICSLGDLLMVAAGAAGFGIVLASFPAVAGAADWVSAVFVLLYGGKLLAETASRPSGDGRARSSPGGRRACVTITAIALTALNPQVYLEMIGVVGSIAIHQPPAARVFFALGVMLVSPLWFFGLALGGQRLTACVGPRRAMRAADVFAGAAMFGIGAIMLAAEVIPDLAP